MNTCTQCKKPLPAQKKGRPAQYCSTACRRSAEMEIKRINCRLQEMETQRDRIISNKRRYSGLFNGYDNDQHEIDDLTEAINQVHSRLLEILRGQDDGKHEFETSDRE